VARRRLDAELVRRGLVASPSEARNAVRDGLVRVSGRPAGNPATLVDLAEPVELASDDLPFVSRGGGKLDVALERFDIEVSGRRALDAGASTGGFTDALLRRGAANVIAVDVAYGQLAWALRNDPRVTVLERTNVRDLEREALPFEPELVVADLSFVSLRSLMPSLGALAARGADFVLLVKPQFEVARDRVGPGGVVRDSAAWRDAIEGVAEASTRAGLTPLAVMASPVRGPAGNVEFPLHAREGADPAGFDPAEPIAEAEGPGAIEPAPGARA
jgi:23S rRNA (cytidine1920-2'-O)/16S rRNA (cytidine1409-2'-O)-methyltransferase